MLRQIRVMRANELEKTLVEAPNTSPLVNLPLEKTKIIASRRMKIPHIARMSHDRYGVSDALCCGFLLTWNIPVSATMLQPRISVVMKVDIACAAYVSLMKVWSKVAPMFPMRYPSMLTTMMVAAVRSMLSPLLRQTMSAIVIVRMVRRSSSSKPESLHPNAVAACRKAKMWMTHDVFICLNGPIFP